MNRCLCLLLVCCAVCSGCGEMGLLSASSHCGSASGIVDKVLDGDTVDLRDGRRVRYLQIDTPEIGSARAGDSECLGEEALILNEELVGGRAVDLEYDVNCTDAFNRTLAYVYVDGHMINRILLERGYARVLIFPPNVRYSEQFENLQTSAQEVRAGLWGACQ